MNVSPFVTSLAVICLLAAPIAAHTAPAIDASRRTESLAPRLAPQAPDAESLAGRSIAEENAFAPGSSGDDDIGQQLILKQVPKSQPFHFAVDGFMFYTNNAARVSAGEKSDSFYGWRAAAAYQPKLTNKLFADISVSEDWFRYNEFEVLNFESFEASASLMYALPELADSLVFAGYHYNLLTRDGDSLLNTHAIRTGIQKTFLIDRRNSVNIGLMGDWDFDSDVPSIKRNEYSFDLGWKFKLMQELYLSLGYRYTYFDYAERGRGDNLHGLAFGVSYMPRKWCEIYLSATFSFNRSNFAVYNYDATNLGGGLGVRIKF